MASGLTDHVRTVITGTGGYELISSTHMQHKFVKVSGSSAYDQAIRDQGHKWRKSKPPASLATAMQVRQLLKLRVGKSEAMNLSEQMADQVIEFLQTRRYSKGMATATQVARLAKLEMSVEMAGELSTDDASNEIKSRRKK